MLFSHISDLHLGLIQYGSEDRENDIYSSFNQAIDISIKDHVDFVIFAGDIFHIPNATGNAILHMANALKLLKQNNIESFFILGEHDISRIRSTPIPYVYHNLGFSKYAGEGKPLHYDDVLIIGYDKIRKNEVQFYEKKFDAIDSIAKNHSGHKILIMHQAINELNKFAGELNSTDLPKNFTYYAMGHLHDRYFKMFNHLDGPVSYPGSIEHTTSEGIKDSKKGFYEVDISLPEAKSTWLKLDTRPQISIKTAYNELNCVIQDLIKKCDMMSMKPIIELKIFGDNMETDFIQTEISNLLTHTLFCFWKIIKKENSNITMYMNKPTKMDDELLKLSVSSIDANLANFAIKELLPLLSSNQIREANMLINENFEKFKKKKNDQVNRIK